MRGEIYDAHSGETVGHFLYRLDDNEACTRVFEIYEELVACAMLRPWPGLIDAECRCGSPGLFVTMQPRRLMGGPSEVCWTSKICRRCRAIVGPLSAKEAERVKPVPR